MDIYFKQPRIMEDLMQYAAWGELNTFKALLERVIDVNKKGVAGDTVLIAAVTCRENTIVQELLRCEGIDLNIVCDGVTALNVAEIDGNFEISQLLKEKGALRAAEME